MFALRIHSVDTDRAVPATSDRRRRPPDPDVLERRGIVYLYRTLSHTPLSNPNSRSLTLFVVAVPNYFSEEDFVFFCASHHDRISQILFIRNDGIEDRYSVLIKLVNQMSADAFYCTFNGKKFSPAEAEVCHMLFVHDVDFSESADASSTPPAGYTELPTCPICLERLDQDTSGILSTQCDHSFHCSCGTKWTYLSCQVCRLCQQHDEVPTCFICGTVENLWVCLICGFVGCGRYKEKHAISHWKNMQHSYSLDLGTQQIWDYVGDTYVHRLNQSKVDGKLSEMESRCGSDEGDCATCCCGEDSVISGALFSSKVEAIFDEYNRLLAMQLETQRQYYESLLSEAKSRRGSLVLEAMEKTVALKLTEIQNELDKCVHEKKIVAEVNQNLIKAQDAMQKKVKEIEERENASLKLKEQQISDLEEQIRDLTVYLEAQKTLDNMTGGDSIKGGSLLPVPVGESSPATTKKHGRSGRRRNR
ncbi:hypothetical protein MLD38_006643 [Melastoma candidum]|uniref:Uncharacterized protein n=1 Tax=Melastoma candidum TaxID=119954 RepID=A0ACB9RX07_9MYRT|nr:hypothetical protein MLD38_006643 [Melastoma candidum]